MYIYSRYFLHPRQYIDKSFIKKMDIEEMQVKPSVVSIKSPAGLVMLLNFVS